jgi:hypothetical protein
VVTLDAFSTPRTPVSGQCLDCATKAALGAANKAARDKPDVSNRQGPGGLRARPSGGDLDTVEAFSGPRTLPVSADARIAHQRCLGRSQQGNSREPTVSNRQARVTSAIRAPTLADDRATVEMYSVSGHLRPPAIRR